MHRDAGEPGAAAASLKAPPCPKTTGFGQLGIGRSEYYLQGVSDTRAISDSVSGQGRPPMPRTFAYARVSTVGQTTENQVLEIQSAGFKVDPRRVVAETISGVVATGQRREFNRLLDRLEPEDVLVVTKLDRLGRNAMDVAATVAKLADMGVRVHCLALGGVDLTSSTGKLTMNVINAVAEFERDQLVERTQAGLARAKAQGKTLGRPSSLAPESRAEIQRRLADGASVSALARAYKTSRQSILRVKQATDLA